MLAAFVLGAACVNSVSASAASGDKITIDGTYLKKAVVSDNPIELTAVVRDSAKRIKFYEKLVWTVVEGEDVAQIADGKVTFKKAGNFTVRAAEEADAYVYSTFSGTAYEATFSNVTLNNSFENITVNTQPMKLSGNIEVRGITPADDCHYELSYEVVSGPAEIYLKEFLRITGKGEVVLKAASKFDSDVFTTVTFKKTENLMKEAISEKDNDNSINGTMRAVYKKHLTSALITPQFMILKNYAKYYSGSRLAYAAEAIKNAEYVGVTALSEVTTLINYKAELGVS